jgi:hypothetical protein
VRVERGVVGVSFRRAVLVAHRAQRARIDMLEAVPAGKIARVEESREAFRGLGLRLRRGHGARRAQQRDAKHDRNDGG